MAKIENRENAAFAVDMLGSIFSCDPLLDSQAPKLFESLAQMDVSEAASDWPFVSPDAVEPLLSNLKAGAAQDLAPLAKEYRRLFIGPNALKAPPYGSVYTDPDQVLFGEATVKLRKWLSESSIGIKNDNIEPEDHIGTMFLLWAWIMHRKPKLTEEYLSDHLLTWAPHYLAELEEATDNEFYHSLATLARITLEGAQEKLGLEVTLPRYYR